MPIGSPVSRERRDKREMPVFRTDFHNHCSCDPVDHLHYSAEDLVDQACASGIQALAITPHGQVFSDPRAVEYAAGKGVLLIPGVEKMIEGREVVILNVAPDDIPRSLDFSDLKKLRQKLGDSILVIAPHPFYPRPTCVGPVLTKNKDLFDAVEHAHLYGFGWNPNRQAVRWAKSFGKAVLANTDCHDLSMVGRNWSEVEAEELSAESIFAAIRTLKVTYVSRPPSFWEFTQFAVRVAAYQDARRLLKKRKPKF